MGWPFCGGRAAAGSSAVKLLVTGATGFVGRHLVAELLARGHQITAVARDQEKARSMPWFEQVRFVALDLHASLHDEQLTVLAEHHALVHLAWPGLPNYKAAFHVEKTLPADFRFIKALVERGLLQVLVTGTCFEYGMQSGCLSEDMTTFPANSYALAKDGLRQQLQVLQRKYDFRLQWARIFYMYGKGQNPDSLLAQLDHTLDRGEKEFRMSGGEQLRDYLPVSDAANQLACLLEHPIASGIYNICSGEPVTVRSLVEQHLEKRSMDVKLCLGYYPYPDHEAMAFWGDAGRIKALLSEYSD